MSRFLLTATMVALLASPAWAAPSPEKLQASVTPEMCSLLDSKAGIMDGLLFYLAKACGRQAEFLGTVRQEGGALDTTAATDAAVSNPATDTSGTAKTQSETSIAVNPVTGVLCSAYNDSFHGVTQNVGFSGYSRSTDGGATWTDFQEVSSDDSGDPSLVWRKADGKFYYAALRNGGLGLYRSDDDCQNFVFVSQIASGNDDKEIMAVDNNEASPFYGRLYVVWTDFGSGSQIFSTHSANAGATWSTQVAISGAGVDVQGAWPVVASNGDVYAGWIAWLGSGFPDGNLEVQIARSTNGGTSYSLVTAPMTNRVNPRESAATSSCGRPALKGNIRYLPSPQIAYDGGVLHAVYTYDPDAVNSGDITNVYYRRSLDNGTTWQTEIQVNDDATTTDQYQPSLSVSNGVVTVGYYSRQNDANNLNLDYYSRTSYNNGASFVPSVRLSDVSSAVVLDPNLASCYHGDYDTQIQHNGFSHYVWSDDRGGTPDVFYEATPAGVDFLLTSTTGAVTVCAPNDAVYNLDVLQFNGFAESVALVATGNPGGTTAVLVPATVTPGNSSVLTIGDTENSGLFSGQVTITGTSTPSNIVHNTTVSLNVYPAAPGSSTLTAPANGSTDIPVVPTFSWSAATNAAGYTLEVATDAAFTNIVQTHNVDGTSFTLTAPLVGSTTYFWRVRANNICGTGSNSAVSSFTTLALFCASPALAIPDNNPTGVTTDIVLVNPGTLTDVDIALDVTHTWVGDLNFTVTHVGSSTTVNLLDNPPSCSADNIDATFDDEGAAFACTSPVSGNVIPVSALSALDGRARNTTWRLFASDTAGQDVGTVNTWCIAPAVSSGIFTDGFETGNTSQWFSQFP